jgi:hypothetical protein
MAKTKESLKKCLLYLLGVCLGSPQSADVTIVCLKV